MIEDVLDPNKISADEEESLLVRPQKLNEYIGQENVKEMLDVYIKAAKMRDESLDHVLLYGPPGLGKTTLATIIANELGVDIRYVGGPSIERPGDLASVLTSLTPGEVLFIDEIHRLPRIVEEILYSAMEDYSLDIIVGKDSQTKSIRIDLPPFTLVGATTRYGDLSSPLRGRFGIISRLNYYTFEELKEIVKRTSKVYDFEISEEAAMALAKRSRGTPRICNRLFRRVRDFAQVKGEKVISFETTDSTLNKLGIDENGLDEMDYRYLKALVFNFKGGPVGIDSISVAIGEETVTIEDTVEPFLIRLGLISRSQRGRMATDEAYKLLKVKQANLFEV